MHSRFLHRSAWAAAALAGLLVAPRLAQAQISTMENNPERAMIQPGPKDTPGKVAPPPALPGATSREGAAPVQPDAGSMSPNEALFDAINRGDAAAARDALSRGAQLDARNVLGLTPMELAVDLGRNDIAFLLLSVRSASGGGASAGGAAAQAQAQPAPKPASAPAAARRSRGRQVAAQSRVPVAEAAPQHAKLFANDGGAPIPSIGFLGFDPQRGTP